MLLTTNGTSGAAELFAAALLDNKRATLVGEHTLGRAGVQKLVKLPDGSALYMTFARYLAPSRHEHPRHRPRRRRSTSSSRSASSAPRAPTNDPILDKALEQLAREEGRVITSRARDRSRLRSLAYNAPGGSTCAATRWRDQRRDADTTSSGRARRARERAAPHSGGVR